MKKLVISLIASLACVASAQAITSNLSQSLNEYETLLASIDTTFQGVISENEFIFDVKRNSKRTVDSTSFIVHYTIKTFVNQNFNNVVAGCFPCHHHKKHHRNKKERINIYDAVLRITPNEAIGPPIVVVLSIKPLRKQVVMTVNVEPDLNTIETDNNDEVIIGDDEVINEDDFINGDEVNDENDANVADDVNVVDNVIDENKL